MKLLVIGSKGFIGSHCVQHFSSLGYEVKGCDIYEDVKEANYISLASIQHNFNTLFSENAFDYCINAAGSAHVNYSFQYPEKDFELNVFLVINILGAIKNHAPQCKLINFSSAAIYGNPQTLPISEDASALPLSPYGYHKLLSENLLYEYFRFFNLQTCSLRVFAAYGEGLKKQLFWDLYQKIVRNKEVVLFGTGTESRDFIYIHDLINIVTLIIKRAKFQGETYNVANGEETTIQEAATVFFEEMNGTASFVFSGEEKIGDPINWKADIDRIKALGYRRQYTFRDGIKKYCKWLKELR